MEPLDEAVDHVRGGAGRLLVEYGDHECPYSRQAYRQIERVEALRRYAEQLGLDLERFDTDRNGAGVLQRIGRDLDRRLASGEVHGTPTLFIDAVVYRGGYDTRRLLEALER